MSSATASRVAIVSGAAQGIGKSIALRLSSDGFDVVLNDLPNKLEELEIVVNLINAVPGRKAFAVVGDASSEVDVSMLISRTLTEFGSLHVVGIFLSLQMLNQLLIPEDENSS